MTVLGEPAPLEANGVYLQFGGLEVLTDLTLKITPGETFGIIGPNGAGKTAFLNCVSGVYRPHMGQIWVDGTEITGKRPHSIARLGVARTFQSAEHFKEFRVIDYVLLARCSSLATSHLAAAVGWPPAVRREGLALDYCHNVLDSLDLDSVAGERLSELPYGMQKRVDIARVLASEAPLVLLDEPTSGTTSVERGPIAAAVAQLREARTVVLIDHDAKFVAEQCDRILAMSAGRSLGIGPPDEVLAQPSVVEVFLGLAM